MNDGRNDLIPVVLAGHQPALLLYCVQIKSSNGPGRCVIIAGKFSYWLSGVLVAFCPLGGCKCTATTSVEPNSGDYRGREGDFNRGTRDLMKFL